MAEDIFILAVSNISAATEADQRGDLIQARSLYREALKRIAEARKCSSLVSFLLASLTVSPFP